MHERAITALLVGLVACTGSKGEQPGAAAVVQRGTLEVVLPAGFAVKVDGGAIGTTPVRGMEVEAGSHVVEVETPCGAAKAVVDVGSGGTSVRAEAFEGLGLATLRVRAKTLQGEPLQPQVSVGEWTVPGAAGAEAATIPACTLRLRIEAEGLGAYVEDVAFAAGKHHEREVVLRPGPDVVRIHGGPFVLGPPAADMETYREIDTFHKKLARIPVEVETFEIDRTEVTIRQWEACLAAGHCKRKVTERLGYLDEARSDQCVYAYGVEEWDAREVAPRAAAPGDEDRPVDCISLREAEKYCTWRGMRIPTTSEWEYAARSGRSDYRWPWGNAEPSCRPTAVQPAFPGTPECAQTEAKTRDPCTNRQTDSEQGVCDLAGNVFEFAKLPHGLDIELNEPPYRAEAGSIAAMGGAGDAFAEAFLWMWWVWAPDDEDKYLWQHFPLTGFRCARSVKVER